MARRKKKQRQVEEESGFGPTPVTSVEDRSRLTPLDVQQKVFRPRFRGYHEDEVDEFLDQVTEDLAALHEENKRLREELELRASPAGFEEAKRHAEETVRRAREEAARIRAEADRHGSMASGAEGGSAPPAFLVRERDFLQELASLVQRHAETLKEEARRAREEQTMESEREPEPERDPEPAYEAERAQEAEPPRPQAAPPATAPDPPSEDEGLLREWSSAFEEDQAPEASWSEDRGAGDWTKIQDEPPSPSPSPAGGAGGYEYEDDGEEQEPSLRELFWGEE
jgi:DivIVA domain-containing protein